VTAEPTRVRWPRRQVLVALTFFASVIAYTDRVNISVAAVAMKETLGWSQTEKGLVLSSFFLGYLVFMLASSWFATRFGGKRVLALSVLAWSAFTLLTPLAAAVSIPALLATRVAMGVGEAGMYPASFELLGRWVPLTERARAVSRLLSGVPIGTVVGLLASGWLVGRYGWPMAFYAFGIVGLLWVVVWVREVSDDPTSDPRVSVDERALLPAALPRTQALADVPWRRLLLRVPVLAILTAHFASNWCLYVLVSWLPSYFRDVQHLSIAHAGLFSAAPWLTMFGVSTLAGSVSDGMIVRGLSVTLTRKLMQGTALLVPAARPRSRSP
jgi:ACS family sodium-dependent inorganic phosphate cotransporter